ncbi:hypothetical protein CFP65_6458 [Kitasatospora sp. MMS16-BH015]|uniref:glycosyltransferase family 2 protein n=1 Tax=Kitasatospora sp. MMS16-BH015 TaxID=2018025 RepID=UPI000CA16DEE|nr:glycosyltransferase family 2 protein [Kitasatospora sp. MMS16-BH015]AUG81114.1 hypothetical protein CFP65_6458 [Kitasatospora sp. MMS16-BH015]
MTLVVEPARVVAYELDEPAVLRAPGGLPTTVGGGPVLALLRRHGHPLALTRAVGGAPLMDELARAAGELPEPGAAVAALDGPAVSVILCTRDRTPLLPGCLDALLRTTHRPFELLLVDNAPGTDATERLVRERYAGSVTYLREPLPGLARARNTGLAAARGEVCAFTDDDAVVEPGWVGALAATFRAEPAVGCVTGLVLPAELETEAQVQFERDFGFGRGFAPRRWSLREPPGDPLFPFAGSRYGTGANMAFRTSVLRGIGGFDPATGTGTPTGGGEDLLAFLQVITAGHTLAYQPDALLWHRHRRTGAALDTQLHGFGVGYGAYLTAAVLDRPRLLLALLRRLPAGLRQARRGDTPASLDRIDLRGVLQGPAAYLASRRLQRRMERRGER